jgi:hypothetical protein
MNKPRLIDANELNDALIDLFQEIDDMYIAGRVISLVNLQPTAYDIDKVVEQLDELNKEHPYKVIGEPDTYSQYNEAWQDCVDRAIEIVKGGAE